MKAYRVHYTIFNYDCWKHYKDFATKEEADKYAEHIKEEKRKKQDIAYNSTEVVEVNMLTEL